jgi:hypothetical protein
MCCSCVANVLCKSSSRQMTCMPASSKGRESCPHLGKNSEKVKLLSHVNNNPMIIIVLCKTCPPVGRNSGKVNVLVHLCCQFDSQFTIRAQDRHFSVRIPVPFLFDRLLLYWLSRIHGSVEDTKLSTNKQHSLSLDRLLLYWLSRISGSTQDRHFSERIPVPFFFNWLFFYWLSIISNSTQDLHFSIHILVQKGSPWPRTGE